MERKQSHSLSNEDLEIKDGPDGRERLKIGFGEGTYGLRSEGRTLESRALGESTHGFLQEGSPHSVHEADVVQQQCTKSGVLFMSFGQS